jgi:hypothetical protein
MCNTILVPPSNKEQKKNGDQKVEQMAPGQSRTWEDVHA